MKKSNEGWLEPPTQGNTDPFAMEDKIARRRAVKALDDLAGAAAGLKFKLDQGREIDARSAGRLLNTHAAEATAELGAIEAYKLVRDSRPEGGNANADS